jgi:hypothetical protein
MFDTVCSPIVQELLAYDFYHCLAYLEADTAGLGVKGEIRERYRIR